MSFRAPALTAFALGLAVAGPAFPSCGDRPGDAQAVADARAAAAAECDCARASSHTGYVDCVARVATRSTCGRPGAVTCCRTRADGTRRCSVSSAALCTSPVGGSACGGDEPS